MGCPPLRGDNPRALASRLSYVQVDKHGITILYHLHQCTPCNLHKIFRVKVGKGVINIHAPSVYYTKRSISTSILAKKVVFVMHCSTAESC